MNLRFYLIAMTMVAVVSDYLLHPFYPQFFKARFNIVDPKQVGYYFAAICFMVMISFPFWAYVSKKITELKILVFTQFIAGILALYCYWTTSYLEFWIVSLVMILFKGSYLLIYPYILKLANKDNHTETIGFLSVVVHFGSILGAILGGIVVGSFNPCYIFLIMGLGDFIQMGTSLYLINSKKFNISNHEMHEEIQNEIQKIEHNLIPKGFVLKIGLITLIFYFSIFSITPFFSSYWESISAYNSKTVSGFVYAIPGVVALFALWLSKNKKTKTTIIPSLLLGLVGIFLQASQIDFIVLLGRILYGWSMFQAVVYFDVLLFDLSTPKSYATDYSKIHFFQNLGVLLASISIGILVENQGLQIPFLVAFIGFIVTLTLYYYLFKEEIQTTEEFVKL
jgi:DHA1 family multidrug resistance protein-like MFS transporter